MESGPQKSATHIRFRQSPPDCAKIIELNWRDNPFFPKILNTTRLDDLKNRLDQYDWVWNGGFRTVVASQLRTKPAASFSQGSQKRFVSNGDQIA